MPVDQLSDAVWLCAHDVATWVILECFFSWVWPPNQLGYAESHGTLWLVPSRTSPGRVIEGDLVMPTTVYEHGCGHHTCTSKIHSPSIAPAEQRRIPRARDDAATHAPGLSTTFGETLSYESI